ncbi:hypothetical protein [Deefgea sp. CFH1-16]|uniref:hypothetical protein n=1 Tax=Deefgea sp. CFH1-16 TaxID=2675457 RepID=UPI0015F6F9E4|nr:hypothetical protein [Deefgea sp. CFH1-16]MBM5573056.1 hypothetical protein [Deefgea sp. CFH1-16]
MAKAKVRETLWLTCFNNTALQRGQSAVLLVVSAGLSCGDWISKSQSVHAMRARVS